MGTSSAEEIGDFRNYLSQDQPDPTSYSEIAPMHRNHSTIGALIKQQEDVTLGDTDWESGTRDWIVPQWRKIAPPTYKNYSKLAFHEQMRKKRILTEEEKIEEQPKRDELNKKIPVYSIVRFPDDQSLNKISIEYWENMVDVNEYIEQQFNNKTELTETLSDPIQFQEFLLKCHRIAVEGNAGDNTYMRVSRWVFSSEDIGALREIPELGTHINKYMEQHLHDVATKYNDAETLRFLHDTRTGFFFKKYPQYKPYFRWIMADPTATPPPSKIDELNKGTSFSVFSRELGEKGTKEHGVVKGGYVFKDVNGVNGYFHTHAEDIPAVLEQMRLTYQELFADSTTDQESALKNIHLAYRAAAICLPVITVWNSINMILTNNLLKKIGYKPISHGFLDTEAIVMDPSASFNHFKDVVEETNRKK